MPGLSRRIVYITGGSSGIGLETARMYSSLGDYVVIIARNPEKLEQARQDIEARKRFPDQRICALAADVADNEAVQEKMKEAVASFGAPDILIANAGVGLADYFENISFEAFDALMKTNVYGVRNVIAALLPFMKQRNCRMAIISSAAGLMGMLGYTAYGTSKYALVGLAECLRGELKQHGIALTLVCPPEVDTPFVSKETEKIPAEARALKNFAGTLKPGPVARAIVKGIERRKFLVIPGMLAKLLYFSHRLTNGRASRMSADLIVRIVQKYKSLFLRVK